MTVRLAAALLSVLAGCVPVASGATWNTDGVYPQTTLAAPTGAIANTETQVLGVTIPANGVRVGTVFRFEGGGLFTNTTGASSSVFRMRIGTTTLQGNVPASVTSANGVTARTNMPFSVFGQVAITATGSSGSAFGWVTLDLANAVQPIISGTVTAAVTVNTTVANVAELTFVSGATTTTGKFVSAILKWE